ncbi:AAA ATPase [Mortierella hygrophila]|uniref:AAA ATPase n=1 Tax=Mortierella hygrophila TaxID=979708 RepID=A0A9P6EZL8_9FUNG|nr:AAA ATPase [Mortierella hygrophila]
MTFLLRKRSLAFSDDENDATHAYPPSPSKRRSETAFRQGLSLQLNLKNTTIPRGPIFVDLDVDTVSVKENTRPESRSRATTPTTPTTTIHSNIGNKNNRSLLQPSTPATTTQTITPPMTPTRRSTRQSTSPPSRKNITYACENSVPPHPNSQQQSIPTTPKRKSSVLKEQSPSFSNTNNNSTGLTPAMNRMLKRPRELNTPNANAPADTTETRKTGYATPKRMSRTRSSLEPLSNSPSSSIRRTLGSNNLSSESMISLSEPQLRRHTSAATGASSTLGYYQDAKALFRRTTEPHRLVGRDAERETIRQFCLKHILTPEAGSLYISGQPGTGKTALLKEIMRDMQPAMEKAPYGIKVLTVNCMTVKDPKLVYHKMLVELGYKSEVGDKEAAINALETLILGDKKNKIMYVTILDEMDQLLTKDQEVLYKLFQWSCMGNSKLTLIGIANALDMTDRFLPRLKAKNCEPQLLNFNPYQVSEIREIIMDRLFSLEGNNDSANEDTENKCGDESMATAAVKGGRLRVAPLMQKPAIELCARKVAAATGDLRKALDICRQTIEMVELETKKKERMMARHSVPTTPTTEKPMPLQEISLADLENRIAGGGTTLVGGRILHPRTHSTSSVPSLSVYGGGSTMRTSGVTIQEAPKVTIEHVKRALTSAFGSPMVQKMKNLNVHQLIVLAVLVIKIQAGKTFDCDVGKVFDHYAIACRSSNKIGAVSRGEYQDLINMLEANGLVTLSKAKEERLRKLTLVPRETEVLDAIKDQAILEAILTKAGVKLNIADSE